MPSSPQHHEQLLSLADIARHFSLPESTARYYSKRFAAFMPSQGEGRRRRYRHECLDVIQAILEHMSTARTASGVEDLLRRQFPCTTQALLPSGQATTSPMPSLITPEAEQNMLPMLALRLMEQQNRAMENIAESLRLLAKRQDDLHALTQCARNAAEENDTLRREIQELRTLLHGSEKVHQDDLDQIRTWVSRMSRQTTTHIARTSDKG